MAERKNFTYSEYAPVRYSPPGHHTRMARINRMLAEAAIRRDTIAREIPAAARKLITTAEIVGIDLPRHRGRFGRYQEAVSETNIYNLARLGEQTVADTMLARYAESFYEEPPLDQWGHIEVANGNGHGQVFVPFTTNELTAIIRTSDAMQSLTKIAKLCPGVESDFLAHALDFPAIAGAPVLSESAYNNDLSHRPPAVVGIFIAARAAETTLIRHQRTTWEIPVPTIGLLSVVRDLPLALKKHTPSGSK